MMKENSKSLDKSKKEIAPLKDGVVKSYNKKYSRDLALQIENLFKNDKNKFLGFIRQMF